MKKHLLKYTLLLSVIFLVMDWQNLAAQNHLAEAKNAQKKYGELYLQYQREGKSDSVLYIAQKFFPIAQRSENDSLKQAAYNFLGNAYNMQSDFGSSLEYYLQSLSLAEKMKDNFRTAIGYENSSWAFYQVGNYQKGAEYGKKAVEIFRANPPKKGKNKSSYYINLANSLDNYASNLLMLGNATTAQKMQLEGIGYLDKADFKEGVYFRSGIYTDLARTYVTLHNDKMAAAYFLKASELNKKWEMGYSQAVTNNYFSDFQHKKGDVKNAISTARTGLNAAISSKDILSAISLTTTLQNAYEKEGEIDSAFYYSKIVNAYRDSVFSSQKILDIQNITFKRENQEREAELEKEKLEEERKTNLQNAAIAIGLIAFFVAYLLFSHSARVGKKTIQFLGVLSMLLVFEFLNLLLHPFIGEITHHQPFWMLLCMVAIAAILIPLHHRLEHWIIHKLIERNDKNRVKNTNIKEIKL